MSKVAILLSTGTNDGLEGMVTADTKERITLFAGPSFHDGKGSAWANA